MKKLLLINALAVLILYCFSRQALKIQNSKSIAVQNGGTDPYLFATQSDDITGSWTLALRTFDDNNNGKLEDEERKKAETGKHFYQFNADGTCLIHTMKMKGSYELKNEAGKKRLYTYLKDEGTLVQENAWYFISVSKTELVLLSQGKQMFWIYKRI